MTLIYQTGRDMPSHTLTVPNEAVRGLRGYAGNWKLFVSDPEPMSVSTFMLSKLTLQAAADECNGGKAFSPSQGEMLMNWLLEHASVYVEKMEAEGSPSMFPKFTLSGPKPALGLNTPQIS